VSLAERCSSEELDDLRLECNELVIRKMNIESEIECYKGQVGPAVSVTRDRCYDFKNIFAEKFCEKIGVFSPKIGKNRKKIVIITSTPGANPTTLKICNYNASDEVG
jgi:hypothetical protein